MSSYSSGSKKGRSEKFEKIKSSQYEYQYWYCLQLHQQQPPKHSEDGFDRHCKSILLVLLRKHPGCLEEPQRNSSKV